MDLNNKELKELIQTHENVQLEFKESKNSLPNDFWSTYSAFANTSGGYIILGVKEENNQNILSGVANMENILLLFIFQKQRLIRNQYISIIVSLTHI